MLRIGAALSLSGRFARFGRQAAEGLRVWCALSEGVAVDLVDDGGDSSRVGPALDALAGRCDLLLGPYSTVLMRAAAEFAARSGRLVWNHGSSGDDVQALAPGHVVSVLTPTSRYAEPFVGHLARHHAGTGLRLVSGSGSFGRQVIAGARDTAKRLGVAVVEDQPGAALFAAGTFEHDTELIRGLDPRPALVGTVAAGVQDFAELVTDPDGIFGVAQWAPGRGHRPAIGLDEQMFLDRYLDAHGRAPDYPAVQAAAAATIATACAHQVGQTTRDALWDAAVGLRTTTLFGDFAVDPVTGTQCGHQMALLRWSAGHLHPVGADH